MDSQSVSGEWAYMEQYMALLFPSADESVKIAYTSSYTPAHTGLRDSGFRVSASWRDVDAQLIEEGRRLFGMADGYGQVQLDASGQSYLPHDEWFDPKWSAYTLISDDGDYAAYLKDLQRAGVETFVWGSDECSDRLRNAVGQDHFIPWERPYIAINCMEAVRQLNGRPVTKGEFGNLCKSVLDETGDGIFPEDADFSPRRPYASVLKHMDLNGLVKVRDLGSGSNKVSIAAIGS